MFAAVDAVQLISNDVEERLRMYEQTIIRVSQHL